MGFNMSEEKQEIKEYAEGWITEKKGTDIPLFLKIAYVVISLGCVAYLYVYMHGEVNHSERGVLVRLLNETTTSMSTATTMMYIVIALAAIYVVALLVFAYSKFHED